MSAVCLMITRSIPFWDTNPATYLPGTRLEFWTHMTQVTCGLKCGRHPKCRSYNFCRPKICELNSEDAFSIGSHSELLEKFPNCVYVGMLQHDQPLCQEGSEMKHIQNDTHPGFCAINGKRVDSQWGPWNDVRVDNETDWIEGISRSLVLEAAHGGTEGVQAENLVWLKRIGTKKNWTEVIKNCKNFEGRLFSKLNGSQSQLTFLCDKMARTSFWVGFTKSSNDVNFWDSINEEIQIQIPPKLWGTRQPSNVSDKNYLLYRCITSSSGSGFHDQSIERKRFSVCDMT